MLKRTLMLLPGIVVLASIAGWLVFEGSLDEPLPIPPDGLVVDVPLGTTLSGLSAQLAEDGILQHPRLLRLHARLRQQAAAIKAGEYLVPAGTTPRQLLEQLVAGQVKLHSLTIVEGWTAADLADALLDHEAISKTASDGRVAGLPGPSPDQGSGLPEGWFFPDTYHFPRGTADVKLLRMAHEKMQTVLDEAWAGRAPGLPLNNREEALVLASIIEKETGLDRERRQVAGVFIRRLQLGMKLQTDPTVIYGLGRDFEGRLTLKHLAQDTPYNTYTRQGLPPGPIALPGKASIVAALHPDDSDALYFVASPAHDGSHVFSASLAEHNRAVRRYRASLKERVR